MEPAGSVAYRIKREQDKLASARARSIHLSRICKECSGSEIKHYSLEEFLKAKKEHDEIRKRG